jgi:hypothetical protein
VIGRKINMKKLIVIFYVILFLFDFCKNLYAVTDPYPQIDIPTFPAAYSIDEHINISQGTKSLSYIVKIEYPATEVLKYYESKFKEKGWIPALRDNFGRKEWECFIDDLRQENHMFGNYSVYGVILSLI